MKKLGIIATALVIGTASFAGSPAPVVETPVEPAPAASSSSGWLIPLAAIALIAIAAD